MNFKRWPRTDVGTVVLHWLVVGAVAVLLLTGLRLASDDLHDLWLRDYDGLMPSNNLWLLHMDAGYVLTLAAVSYAIYLTKARLLDRIRLNATRLKGLFGAAAVRWNGLNVLLYWAFLSAALGAIVTGWMAYFGFAAPVLQIHLICTWVILAFPLLHVLALLRLGGVPHLVRIFRPKRAETVTEEIDLADVVADLLAEKRAMARKAGQSN